MNKNRQIKQRYQVIFIFALAGLFIIPASANVLLEIEKNVEQKTFEKGLIIYVNVDNTEGPWDGTIDHPYQYIQDGIDHAVDGDTIYVFEGDYPENVVVGKSVILIGDHNPWIHGYSYGGTIVKILAENVTLIGFTITHCGSDSNNAGVMVHTSHNIITNNEIRYNDNFGIYVLAGNNSIYHNNFIENAYQAFDVIANSTWDGGYPTGGNYWDDYTGTDANDDGIGEIPYPTGNSSADQYPLVHPYGSIVNEDTDEVFLTIQAAISDNDTLAGQMIFVNRGTYLGHILINKSVHLGGTHGDHTILDGISSGDVVTISADDVRLEGFVIQHSGVEEQNAGVVVSGANCSIVRNTITENYQGIVLGQSTMDAQIAYNQIRENGWNGITLKPGCAGIHIFENTISDNFYAGVAISDASGNYLYHNNFMKNRYQAYDDATNVWDNGYPSGGNYWDDYSGIDANGDGMGDTSYLILNGFNIDRYPYMDPYTGEDTIPPAVTIISPLNGLYIGNLRLLPWLFRQQTIAYGDIFITVEAEDMQSGIEKVEFYVDDTHNPAFVTNETPYTWKWTQSYLLRHQHTIFVVAYDTVGNYQIDEIVIQKYL